MMRFRFLVTVVLLLPLSAQAAETITPSRVDAVTVFPSGAEVTRTLDTSLTAGSHVLIVQDLPAAIERNSIRVEGKMSAGVEVGSIDTRSIFIKEPPKGSVTDESERKRLEREIESLADEKATLQGLIDTALAQKALAENLAKLPLSGQRPLPPAAEAPTDWNALFEIIGARLADIQTAILEAKVKQRDIDRKIVALSERLNLEPPVETERTELRIYLEAQTQASGIISIRYQSADAGWEPVYDARLTSKGKEAGPALTIVRRASVAQNTGEDWDGVTLTLSTARPGETTAPPELSPVQVDFRPLPQPQAYGGLPEGAPRAAMPKAADAMPEAAAGADGFAGRLKAAEPIIEKRAAVEASTYQAVFKIAAKVSLKTGAGAKKVLIGAEKIQPVIKVVTVPKETAAAFINAHFTLESDAALLPGEVSLYRDNVFIGAGELPLIADGEEHDLGFGVDDAVKVNRISVKREKGETGLLTSSNTDEQHFRITLKNLRAEPVTVTVFDQIPYSEDEKIVVEILPLTTQPYESNHDNKRGILAWEMALKPGEEKNIELSYQINWPAKREIITLPR